MTRLTLLLFGSFVLGIVAANAPEKLRDWVGRWLRRFPAAQSFCVRFVDRLLAELEVRYPARLA